MKTNIPSMAITYSISGILMISYGEKTKQEVEGAQQNLIKSAENTSG